MPVRSLIDVRAGVEWVRAMEVWVLITIRVVVWGFKVVLISVIHTHSKKGSELVLHRFTAKPLVSLSPS